MQGDVNQRAAARLLADEYAERILSATFVEPKSIQQISRLCDIPIAVAYRRVATMEELCLIRCVREDESYRGKKVKLYSCAVRSLQLAFSEGEMSAVYDPLP
ncbi:MAG: helix-turn-helix domain-containing protein [Methanomassiliicoccales archaeon]|jgi:DNA-binding IclR family transcriptional regulator